ncbi:hypothetical protein ACTFIW_006025 [Dictyostelium discoideum]|uniref:DNA-directed RNA polymerase subunit n=1 Tax=Dictyostelium discoideum TaxID=44689 RepID=Q54K02_DICDI|nr:RNA polymerase III subunit [Dictyostelium discoideum AX4]EAL63500.1 RNA polymerase III subunit [Dictyostelium discoideum AX4]|eukprot:XP_637000.1 RNA polymerase III subunit [Dictyostelium discoideum AX4]
MLFCPLCANMLLIDPDLQDTRYFCQTCPYIFHIKNKVVTKVPLQRKIIDSDVFGGEEAWKSADVVEVECQVCRYRRASLIEIQVDPIGQPKTSYYRCKNPGCENQWQKKNI